MERGAAVARADSLRKHAPSSNRLPWTRARKTFAVASGAMAPTRAEKCAKQSSSSLPSGPRSAVVVHARTLCTCCAAWSDARSRAHYTSNSCPLCTSERPKMQQPATRKYLATFSTKTLRPLENWPKLVFNFIAKLACTRRVCRKQD